jgi:hypothetical protein
LESFVAVSITNIPAPYRAGLAKIKRLLPVQVESIAKTLENAPLSGGLKGLASAVAQNVPGMKRQDVEIILRSVFSLSVLVTDEETPLSQNLESVTSAMQATGDRDLALSEKERAEFEKRLERLLTIRTVVLASKVQRLGLEYPNVFYDAMIVTDMRPVFDKPEDRPVGCAISHTLRIAYHEGGEHKEFYVVLNADDLELMKKIFQRAESKALSLKSVLKVARLAELS